MVKMTQEIAIPKLPYLIISRREPCNLFINYFCSPKAKVAQKISCWFYWKRNILMLMDDNTH